MEGLTIVYLAYGFVSIYFLTLFLLTYLQNRRDFYESPKIEGEKSLSIVLPCYNAEKVIEKTIMALVDSDYAGLKKIVVVDDCSTDNTYKIAKSLEKKFAKVMVVQTPKNTGRAAGAKNYGAKFVDTELIGFTDDDSRPNKDAISFMIGYFNDPKVGGVTSRVLVYNRKTFLERFQAIEYKVIAFTRKILGFLDSIYVTNGPLSIYTKKAFDEVGGFNMKNWTEDIEITWHLVKNGYNIKMAIPAKVYTFVPSKFKPWLRQRLRWNVGGLQTMIQYRNTLFRCGMLGLFIVPYFVLSWGLAIFGLCVLFYRVARTMIIRYLATSYSIHAQTAILNLRDISLTPGILVFFGIIIFSFSLAYNFFALSKSKEEDFKRHSIFSMLGYMIFYLTVYPLILIISIINLIKGKDKW